MIRKGQTTAEFFIVILVFILILLFIAFSLFRLYPSEVGKIKEQSACSIAETISDSFFRYEGNATNWDSGGSLTTFGLSTSKSYELDYDKWKAAVSRGYRNITISANINESFLLEYAVYAFNLSTDTTPNPLPNETVPQVYLVRDFGSNQLRIISGSNSTKAKLNLKLFFPYTTITLDACPGLASIDSGDVNTTSTRDGGSELEVIWTFADSDLDCVAVNITTVPDLIYIKEQSLSNTSLGKDYYVYMGNHTITKQEFGSSGFVDPAKSYCGVNRKGLLAANSEVFPVDLTVTARV